jgi:uridine kinase
MRSGEPLIVIVIGVAASGKTTLGKAPAEQLECNDGPALRANRFQRFANSGTGAGPIA